ncbi:MAG: hypothetical protein A2015_03700 [Spirochaetes bacterium GWF1_31_7]|nr:MAG: hypothetical protein A2Y29_04930 [Spirochaetes bacterium GWE2_31_10]OHD53240.1 MAG: hypothetical protein A2015_03700 [Spirochaetes bacterium GWF1_31_7]OHD83118.1 MAG: hypothetical protein A2355_11525 [Spirochaetes bacterium RIFOXYB1_FULL_32_8]HBD94729.1 hypothetical protein [Spirochaetia bacterium]HBI39057.1 hypothetical protein [Spirochaetia bacterium]
MKSNTLSIIEGRVIATPEKESLNDKGTHVTFTIITKHDTGFLLYTIRTQNQLADTVCKYITKQQIVRIKGKLLSSFEGFTPGIIQATTIEFISNYSNQTKTE